MYVSRLIFFVLLLSMIVITNKSQAMTCEDVFAESKESVFPENFLVSLDPQVKAKKANDHLLDILNQIIKNMDEQIKVLETVDQVVYGTIYKEILTEFTESHLNYFKDLRTKHLEQISREDVERLDRDSRLEYYFVEYRKQADDMVTMAFKVREDIRTRTTNSTDPIKIRIFQKLGRVAEESIIKYGAALLMKSKVVDIFVYFDGPQRLEGLQRSFEIELSHKVYSLVNPETLSILREREQRSEYRSYRRALHEERMFEIRMKSIERSIESKMKIMEITDRLKERLNRRRR